MRIFLTGASGFIGSRILPALQASGHQVIGLARSESTAQALKAAGAEVHRGTLDAPESLLAGVGNADAVIHTAFDHDFSRFAANCEKDRQAILALGQAAGEREQAQARQAAQVRDRGERRDAVVAWNGRRGGGAGRRRVVFQYGAAVGVARAAASDPLTEAASRPQPRMPSNPPERARAHACTRTRRERVQLGQRVEAGELHKAVAKHAEVAQARQGAEAGERVDAVEAEVEAREVGLLLEVWERAACFLFGGRASLFRAAAHIAAEAAGAAAHHRRATAAAPGGPSSRCGRSRCCPAAGSSAPRGRASARCARCAGTTARGPRPRPMGWCGAAAPPRPGRRRSRAPRRRRG